jgi:hypothetical protein
MGFTGAATVHAALSDAADFSFGTIQLSASEPGPKFWKGDLPNLADGAGVATSIVVNVRAVMDDVGGGQFSELWCGEHPNPRVGNALTHSIANYSSAPYSGLTVAQLNAAKWMAGAVWNPAGTSTTVHLFEISFDVNYNFVNGVTVAMIFEWLGPLVAVGLGEMPALARELWRRGRVRLRAHELEPAWRELREHRARRHFILAR